eukprot:GHVP01067142.1.p1 GENE.GHVP01067142.1~~GHVP01067142.1.p1  ORF type:complete len:668 (+),score=96.76 GHVP01067142.1:31-2004(+)
MSVIVSACSLNQWALDFEGNLVRILESLRIARENGASIRSGPELEICGYGCEDHFYETDTVRHSWEVLHSILESKATEGILCDFGMPVYHRTALYNCRVLVFNSQILLIRPKAILANSGVYRESRYFAMWKRGNALEEFLLPLEIQILTSKTTVPFGLGVLQFLDVSIGLELCEELWAPESPHTRLALDGVDIILNGSGSYHQLGKFKHRVDLLRHTTTVCGGLYVYSNLKGCDGGRLYFDGGSMMSLNGEIIAQCQRFTLDEVDVVTTAVSLEEVQSYRASLTSLCEQAAYLQLGSFSRVKVNNFLTVQSPPALIAKVPEELNVDQEIGLGAACWLWDHFKRTSAAGFFVPLSGGADSAAVSTIVFQMSRLIFQHKPSIQYVMERLNIEMPNSNKELCGKILHTAYLKAIGSSECSQSRAKNLAEEINTYHLNLDLSSLLVSIINFFSTFLGIPLKFFSNKGSRTEDLALQNLQARFRMVVSYFLGAILPLCRGQSGFLLILGTGNVDEGLRGYFTKYDCSSADLNPIGSISKCDLTRWLRYCSQDFDLESLNPILEAPPSAELTPLEAGKAVQTDENDMGMTYEELSLFGFLRKSGRMGPYSMMKRLKSMWDLPVDVIREKVIHFFYKLCKEQAQDDNCHTVVSLPRLLARRQQI